MASTRTLYHLHGMDWREFMKTYMSGKSKPVFIMDTVKFPMEKVYNAISSAGIKDGTLTDISLGSFIHHLLQISSFFKEMSLLRFSDKSVMELRKWKDGGTGSSDGTFVSSVMDGLQGNRDEWEVKEKQLKQKIKQVVKSNIANTNLTDPVVLPQADVVTSAWTLDVTSTDAKAYATTLRKILKLVKPGGLLLLIGPIEGTVFKVGKDHMHLFTHDEEFVKNALTKEGLTVIECDVIKRTTKSDLTDYEGMSFVAARRNK